MVEGLTITRGHGYFSGGAVLTGYDASPRLLRCRFVENTALGGGGAVLTGSARIEDCVFLDNSAYTGGALILNAGGIASVIRCTFARNVAGSEGGAIGAGWGHYLVSGCTFFANQAPEGSCLFSIGSPPDDSEIRVENSIISFSRGGEVVVCWDMASDAFICCDLFGNEGGDWGGCAQGQGANGNISADPLFCGAETDDYTVADTSPCAPDHNPECGLIGAWPVGCQGPVPVERSTWGQIKARYAKQ